MMTPAQLRKAGKRLFGDQWKSPLGRAIGRGYLAIHRMAEGDDPINPAIEIAVAGVEAIRDGFVPSWATDNAASNDVLTRVHSSQGEAPAAAKPKTKKRRALAVAVRP